MDHNFDRPNLHMRAYVDAVLRAMESTGRCRAASNLERAGVPLRVIGCVIGEPQQRRAPS